MSKLQEFTYSILQEVSNTTGDREQFLDGAFGVIITEILVDLLGQFDFCGETPEGISQRASRPSFWDKRAAKALVRKQLGGWREYRRNNGQAIVESLFKVGKDVHVDEIRELLEEV